MGERKRKIEWQVIRLRARGEYVATVTAPDEQSVMKAPLKMLRLETAEAKRLLVRQYRR